MTGAFSAERSIGSSTVGVPSSFRNTCARLESAEYIAAIEPSRLQANAVAPEIAPSRARKSGCPLLRFGMKKSLPDCVARAEMPRGETEAMSKPSTTEGPRYDDPGTPKIGRIDCDERSNTKPGTGPLTLASSARAASAHRHNNDASFIEDLQW